ncbi:hypothetical protein [Marinicella rhabdoformis]|uniref:hypothetical protein n=1 Tax=Marinicella rhabdoformis TaxID=2580566 RepID=UPI0012AECB84|nr:hypothetical protein [Marinicella rhabdoformis]
MKIIKFIGASLLLVSPYISANSDSEWAVDSHEVSLKENRGLATTGGAIKFATYGASSAQPLYSSNTYTYAGAGCISNSGNSTMWMDESINSNIPIGSTIVSVGLFYRDNGDGGSSFVLQNYDAQNGIGSSVNVSAPAVNGASSSGAFTWLVTTASEYQVARFTLGATPSADPCLVRIGYIPFDIADDVIFASRLEY